MRTEGLSAHLDPLDWLAAAASAPDLAAAGTLFEDRVSRLGGASVGVVFEMPKTFGTFPGEGEMYGHFINPEWHAFYHEHQHLIRHDVMARHLFTSQAPHYVDIRDRGTIPGRDLTAEEQDFIELAVDFGMKQTIGIAFRDRRARRVSIVMVNQPAKGPGDLGELGERHLPEFHLAAHFFVEGLHLAAFAADGTAGRLSDRERDCLSWAATGRTTKEIADLMVLSDDTVDEYFASAIRKLRAANRTQAVARALALRLISP